MTKREEEVEPRDCPYVGLDYYQEKFGAWFFGREADGSKIITNMQAARLTLLHAESGVGKSSLLRAGVAWRLRRLLFKESSSGAPVDVPVVFSSWKDDPVLELVDAIGAAIEPLLTDHSKPELPADRLDAAIEAAADAVNAPLLVVLDQFEEYFLYCSREPTPERFADQLARCINRTDLPANFLIAIREDAYASLGDLFKGRIANVYGNYLHIDYLDRASAEEAIRAPLDVYNGFRGADEQIVIQDGLVKAVLDQVRAYDTAGVPPQRRSAMDGADRVATPLLQLVMETVWKRERAEGSRELRLSTLQRLEGVKKIVDTHLGNALRALSKTERETAIEMFDHLVTPSGGKIAESVSDLAHRTRRSDEQIGGVLQKLDQARIVRPVPAPPGQDPVRFRRYEIFHDVLAPAINHILAAREERRRARRLRRLATLAVGLLILALAVGGAFASLSRSATIAARNADHQRNLAVSTEVATESEALDYQEPMPASLLAVAAWRIAHTPQARVSMLDALAQPDHGVPLVGHYPAVGVAFSPDGKTLATASAAYSSRTGSARVWNVATRQQEGVLLRPRTGEIAAVAFSPAHARILATAGIDGFARLWDASTRRQLGQFRAGHSGRLTAVAFSPDGKTVATAGADGIARLWDLATGRPVARLRASRAGAVNAVAFSSDGKTVATAGADGTARLWDLATGRQIGTPLVAGTGAVNAVAFSPDGKTLATAGEDGTARLWDVTVYRQLGVPLVAGAGAVNAVAFSPDGKSVAAAGADGTVRLWALPSGRRVVLRAPGAGALYAVAFSSDGTTVAAAGADGTVRLWALPSGRPVVLRAPGAGALYAVALSRDGKTLAAAGADGTVRLWDLATRQRIGTPLVAGAGAVNAVAFRRDGKTLATAGADGIARLWDVATHRKTGATAASTLGFKSVAISPDGKTLATAGNNKIRLWSGSSGILRQIRTPLASGNDAVNAVAFSPDNRMIATASEDGTARLWDKITHQQVGPPLLASRRGVNDVAFSPDGKVLATANADGTVQLWNIALPKDKYLAPAVCSISGRSLKRNEWVAFFKSEPFQQICPYRS